MPIPNLNNYRNIAVDLINSLESSLNSLIDARLIANQVVNGTGNGIVRRVRVLFGVDATQVNHLAISKVG